MMKFVTITGSLLAVVFSLSPLCAENTAKDQQPENNAPTHKPSPKIAEKVEELRKLAQKIDSNANATLKKVVLQTGLRPSFDPKLTRFTTTDGEVAKLEVEVKGDRGITNETYYFHKGNLFFIKAGDQYWQFEDISKTEGKESDAPTIHIASRLRYYYDHDVCIRVVEKHIESKNKKGLETELKQVKNEAIEIGPAATMYQEKSSSIREIKSQEDLKNYLIKKFKNE